jgi:hypothetical protein
MNKCCKCEKPATRSTNAPEPSHYCDECGVCAYCHESVEFFVPYKIQDTTIYLCPCVRAAIAIPPQPRPAIPDLVEEKPENVINIKDLWRAKSNKASTRLYNRNLTS